MTVSAQIREKMKQSSWIRRMFEEGAQLKKERGAENVFDFSLGNPEIEPPAELLEALARAVASAPPHSHAYMSNAGYVHVRDAVAAMLRESTGLPYDAQHVIMTVGAAGAINSLMRAILSPGDEVIVPAPYFAEYRFYVENHGGTMVNVDTDDTFELDVDAIEAAITPRTKAILINSPNNPTGVIYKASVLEELGRRLERAGQPITLVSDEPYKALTFDDERAPEVPCCVARTVIATSWSKALAIPGERIGYLAISPRIDDAAELAEACSFTLRTLGFVNAPALWQRVVAEAPGLTIDIAPYQAKRDLLCGALESMGYQLVRPHGAFYVFPRTPIPDDVEYVRLLQQHGVLAVPGVAFGRAGHMRISLTVSEDEIRRALPGFEAAIRQVG